MRLLALLLLLGGGAGLSGQTADWTLSPLQAEALARSEGKPLILLWQAGPDAAAFTQGVERLFSSWPAWTARVIAAAVLARGRSWEAPLPASFPALADAKSSALVVWQPGGTTRVWTRVPPALEFSRELAAAGGPAGEPYTLDVVFYTWQTGSLARREQGPWWTGAGDAAGGDWAEEGPLGSLLLLTQPQTGRRVAFPMDDGWSFVFDAGTQSWSPWNPSVVKRR